MDNFEVLKRSFTRMKSGEIVVKNRIVTFLLAIWAITLAVIFFIFLGIFIAKEPMTFNDVLILPTDPEYQTKFISTLLIMGVFLFLIIIGFIVSVSIKSKPWVYWMHDIDDKLVVYEVTRLHCRLVGQDYLIIYNKLSNSIYETDSKSEIKNQLYQTLFWTLLDDSENVTIKLKKDYYKVVYNDKVKKQKRTFNFRIDDTMLVSKYSEMVSTYYSGSNFNKIVSAKIENINRLTRLPLEPKIAEAFSKHNY